MQYTLLRFSQIGSLALVFAVASGCSAIINPDTDRLGGSRDAGGGLDGGGTDDAGPRPDGGGTDAGPTCPPSCDDSVSCTDDRCEAGRCVNEPNDALCGADQRCNRVMGCVPRVCMNDGQCDDGLFCNGTETCVPGSSDSGCVPGTMVACDDGASCTEDMCDDDVDACRYVPHDERCSDPHACTANRCDPGMTSRETGCVFQPDNSLCNTDFCVVGATCSETSGCGGGTPRNCADADPCTAETCNEAADRCDSAPVDADMDGFPAVRVGGTMCAGGTDCDDSLASVHPGAAEICGDGIDNDCMGGDMRCATDDCSAPTVLTFDIAGDARATGMFAGLSDDYQTSALCTAATGGRDIVYAFDLPIGDWDVTIDTNGSAADTVLAIGTTCDMAGFQSACNDDQETGAVTDSRIWLHHATGPSRIYVLVDAFGSSTTGAYALNVRRRAAFGDGCTVVGGPFDLTGGGTLVGRMARGNSFYNGSCPGATSGTEAIFYVGGSGASTFDVYSSDFNPDVYLRRGGCGSGTEVGCVHGSAIGGGVNRATLNATLTSGTDYYLFIDGAGLNDLYVMYYQP
ncbi:MAG: putative metal-binding motif-containing protein [Sandaracinaceae bacterium]